MNIFDHINQFIGASPALIEALSIRQITQEVPKGTVLLMEGDICRKLFFVEKGLLRVYYFKKTKTLHIGLFLNNDFLQKLKASF